FRLHIDFGVEPTFDRTAAGKPQRIVIVEVQVVRAEAGVNRRDLLGFGIVELDLAAALVDRHEFRRRMARSFLTERLRLILTDSRCNPYAAFLVHGEAVSVRLTRPDRLVAPVWRCLRRFRLSLTRRLRIANRQLDLTRRVADRIHDRYIIRGGFQSAVDKT